VIEVKEKMSVSIKRGLLVLMLAVFALTFAGEAQARPDWIKCSYTPSIVVTGQNKGKSDYLSLKIVVEYTNNNPDGAVIAKIFNKTLTFSATSQYSSSNKEKAKGTVKSTKVSGVEIYPGQSTKLWYLIPVNKLGLGVGNANWTGFNDLLLHTDVKKCFTDRSYSHDFQVRTE
jgi:hypothetical protein